jgi:SAM-dependent methyltransferase
VLLYDELIEWYRVLTPPSHYEEEAALYLSLLREHVTGPLVEALELGCGAGHNASWMKRELALTLSDLSPKMLALSASLNPECVHVQGDMRTLRLGRTFDAVFVHDAVAHMTRREDLAAVIRTARAHLRPGGAVLLAPDDVKDTFAETVEITESTEGPRVMRTIERHWDPDPSDELVQTDFSFELTDEAGTREVHDRCVFGIFWLKTWWELLQAAGLGPAIVRRPDGPPMLVGRLDPAGSDGGTGSHEP